LARLLYAVLSLTVIRMVPVFLCLIGTRTSTADKLFIGWFGPRGLATIVCNPRPRRKAARQRHDHARGRLDGAAQRHRHGVTANPLVKAIGTRREGAAISG
jgi:sodium/hydrogen antiporter